MCTGKHGFPVPSSHAIFPFIIYLQYMNMSFSSSLQQTCGNLQREIFTNIRVNAFESQKYKTNQIPIQVSPLMWSEGVIRLGNNSHFGPLVTKSRENYFPVIPRCMDISNPDRPWSLSKLHLLGPVSGLHFWWLRNSHMDHFKGNHSKQSNWFQCSQTQSPFTIW